MTCPADKSIMLKGYAEILLGQQEKSKKEKENPDPSVPIRGKSTKIEPPKNQHSSSTRKPNQTKTVLKNTELLIDTRLHRKKQ